jgi:hypothetical protein
VLEVVEHLESARDRLVLLLTGEIGDRADAAVVVLEVRVVEASGLGSLSHGVLVGEIGGAARGPK